MSARFLASLAVSLLATNAHPAPAAAPPGPASPPAASVRQAREAAARGLIYLSKDAEKWRAERKCATCHHGTLTVWAFSEAKRQGYAFDATAAADLTKWTLERFTGGLDKPRDGRPGFKMVSTPALYLGVMALAVPGQEALPRGELKRIVGHLLRHQEKDGSWSWSSAPPKNRPPPHFESDEVATLLGYLALESQVPANPRDNSAARSGRERAAKWLGAQKLTETTQTLGLWLYYDARTGRPAKVIEAGVARLLARQNRDGGWGQLKGDASDAYATGQALYYLGVSGVKGDRKEVQRGVSFLVATQKQEGSWPMTPRGHKGERPASNAVPITYLGSAWAALGLMRSVPNR